MTDRITTLSHEGLTFDVSDEGPLDGEVVVLLHGFPERASSWRLVRPALHEAGYRTVAMDQRGYSPGARPRRRRDYTMRALMGDALALVEAVTGPAGRVHVVGHDWGAIPSWLLALHHPDRIRSLTAVSVPHPAAFLTSMARSPQLLHSWYMLFFQLPFVPERVLGSRLADRLVSGFGMTADDAARFRTEILEYGALPTALNWYRALPFGDPRLVRGKVTVPTTMVWSDGDVAVEGWGPENSERWVEAPFRYLVLEGVSHWIPTQAPEALAEAILVQVREAGRTGAAR